MPPSMLSDWGGLEASVLSLLHRLIADLHKLAVDRETQRYKM